MTLETKDLELVEMHRKRPTIIAFRILQLSWEDWN